MAREGQAALHHERRSISGNDPEMISALDSSVILDVLVDGPQANRSEALLRKAMTEGKLVIGECVLAEIAPAFKDEKVLAQFLADWQIEFVPSSCASASDGGPQLRPLSCAWRPRRPDRRGFPHRRSRDAPC